MWMQVILTACVLAAASGVPGLFVARRARWGQICATAMMALASALGITVGLVMLCTGRTETANFPGIVPGTFFELNLDPLSAFFLVSIFLLGAMSSIYGLGYWPQPRNPRTARRLQLCLGFLLASLATVTLAGDGVLFLVAWEIMALSAFFLISTEDHKPEVRKAGWIYLLAAHGATLLLFALFALLRYATGSFQLRPLHTGEVGIGLQTVLFLLGLVGFGLKAGVMPLHFWLPGAHANAPSHVSAILSGVLLKIGIYGLLRLGTLLPNPPAVWGILVLILGAISALLGVAFALGQHDLKRLLAYHSVENIGIILMGLGVAMIGQSTHQTAWVVLGIGGCLLHVWNHGLFKSLLFLAAGSVLHATATRDIDALGGLGRRMPWTAVLFAIGAVAICGLPPLNGFVSELLIYLGLFRSISSPWGGISLAAPVLAMVGALAVACFVKAHGAVFLGTGRTPAVLKVHESPLTMLAPMTFLAAVCVVIGLLPTLVAPLLDTAIASWAGPSLASDVRIAALFPGRSITTWGLYLVGASAVIGLLFRVGVMRHQPHRAPTWGCGYTQAGSRMQYTASSFAQMLVTLFRWVLRPRVHRPEMTTLFPGPSAFHSSVPEAVVDGIFMKAWSRIKSFLTPVRNMQQGRIQHYILYVLLALMVLLLLQIPLADLIQRMLEH
jgi:hydrogenase-4 component B